MCLTLSYVREKENKSRTAQRKQIVTTEESTKAKGYTSKALWNPDCENLKGALVKVMKKWSYGKYYNLLFLDIEEDILFWSWLPQLTLTSWI